MFLKEIIYFLVNYPQHGQTNRYLKHPTDLKLFLDALVSPIQNYLLLLSPQIPKASGARQGSVSNFISSLAFHAPAVKIN